MKCVSRMIVPLFLAFCVLLNTKTTAQPFEDASQYFDHITKAKEALTAKYLAYLSASAHGKSLRKVEKKKRRSSECYQRHPLQYHGNGSVERRQGLA